MLNVHAMDQAMQAAYEAARSRVRSNEAFAVRLERFFGDLWEPLTALYGHDERFEPHWRRLVEAMAAAAYARPLELRRLDHEREITPDWLLREQAVGYVTYVDRFAGTLAGVRERLPYLRELGVDYLHLMPLLATRPEPNDGGYAVTDYAAVQAQLGTMDDLRALADALHAEGMSLCIDVVLNHTAREHPWARAAAAGDPDMLARYRTFPDRTEPDAYEATLPDVFPDIAPGNFTWEEELGRWVWTTFNTYQWDLDYTNPDVFVTMAIVMVDLAAAGVDVLRLDAVPFMWKRLGTNSQNQPEVHDLLQAFRAVLRIAAPAVAFKAEAIVAPRDLVRYLGVGRHHGRECQIAYHNVLMVLGWSALASGRARLITETLQAIPELPSGAGWATYVRGHDDIGWAITEEDAGRIGENAHLHRRFLADFYAGDFPGSFGHGARFQPDGLTGEARTSGTSAALTGLEHARTHGDETGIEHGIRRMLLLHAIAFAHGGIPLLYMGDELGLPNDPNWADDPAHAPDNRWMHRPWMDWDAAARRSEPDAVEGRLWAGIRRLVEARRATKAVHADGRGGPVWTDNDHVFALVREHAGHRLLLLANLTGFEHAVHLGVADLHGFTVDLTAAAVADGRPLRRAGAHLLLGPYQFAWIGGTA